MAFLGLNVTGFTEEALARGYVGVSAFQTFSKGWLRIATTDPNVDPDIEISMLSDERDLVRMRDGARRLFALVRHPAIAAICEGIELAGSGFALTGKESRQTIEDLADDGRARCLDALRCQRHPAPGRHLPHGRVGRSALGGRIPTAACSAWTDCA